MKILKINDNWSVNSNNEGSVLIFTEKRINKEKQTEYTFEDKFYYPCVQTALQAYLIKTLDDSKDLKDVLRVIEKTKQEIKNSKQEIKN